MTVARQHITNGSTTGWHKPRMLMIVDSSLWILGRISEEIVAVLPDYPICILASWQLRQPDRQIRNYLKESQVVFFLCNYAYTEFQHATWLKEKAVIATVHHIDENMSGYLDCIQAVNAIMVTSNQWRHYLIDAGIPPDRIIRVPYGVDTKIYHPGVESNGIRQRMGIPDGLPVIGFFAKKSPPLSRKGADVFLQAIQILKKRKVSFHILLVGPGWEQEVHELRLADLSVSYVPYAAQKEMPQLFSLLSIYICASRIEGGPVPILESLASGIPVISTRVGIAEEMVRNGETGFLVDFGAPAQIADHVMTLLGDPELRLRLGRQGRALMEQQFQWKEIKNPILNLITKAMNHFAATNDISCLESPALSVQWQPKFLQQSHEQTKNLDTIRFALRLFRQGRISGGVKILGEWLDSPPLWPKFKSIPKALYLALITPKWRPESTPDQQT